MLEALFSLLLTRSWLKGQCKDHFTEALLDLIT